MISAYDVLDKHQPDGRYLYRHPDEPCLAYQLAGADPQVMAEASKKLQDLGADIIDINCGCPKQKIRKKGYGSALLEQHQLLLSIVRAMRQAISIPLTVKIRINQLSTDCDLAKMLESEGIDALIVHGRNWQDGYDIPCNLQHIAQIKESISIPLIVNGDVCDTRSAEHALTITKADALMIGRAATGRPWLYRNLLEQRDDIPDMATRAALFIEHIELLAVLESPFKAVLQSRSLFRYYFREWRDHANAYYQCVDLDDIKRFLAEKSL